MRYHRAVMLVELANDPAPAFAALRQLTPSLEELVVLAWAPPPLFAGLLGSRASDPDPETAQQLERVTFEALRSVASARVRLIPDAGSEALLELCREEDVDLVVDAALSFRSTSAVYELRRSLPVPVLFVRGPGSEGPLAELYCFPLGRRGVGLLGTFLRDHAGPSMRVTLGGPQAPTAAELEALRELAGVRAAVETTPSAGTFRAWTDEWLPARPVHLLVITEVPRLILLAARWPAPVLLLPPPRTEGPREGELDVADVAEDRGVLRTRVDRVTLVGNLPAAPDQDFVFVAGGRVLARARSVGGQLTLAGAPPHGALGLSRVTDGEGDPLTTVEHRISVVRPGDAPLVVFDAELSEELLGALPELVGPPAPDLLAVRLRPTHSCVSLRERLARVGLAPRVIDARAVLDEGDALDVSEATDAVRLARVAHRLRGAGYLVAALLHRRPLHPHTEGFLTLSEPELRGPEQPATSAVPAEPAPLLEGHHVELELDNGQARRWLLEAISGARRTLHFQVYMCADDEVGAAVETALAAAAARGVAVRVLVDSVHGRHGSFGAENPLLARLATRPGVELRIVHPINELPSLEDLKLRDHRKLVVADGALALIGGRNLAHEYYAGFGEVAVGPDTPWRRVPWLDAGARLRGPAAAAVERAFLGAWVQAGGTPFGITTPPPAGDTSVRVVVHHGLRDARTLEVYREHIESSRERVDVVNGFPLMLELQHVLLGAVRRGVRVRVLAGHFVPRHDGRPFEGPLVAARNAGTEMVHSRLDPLVAAGAEVFLLGLRDLPGWAPGLGLVEPHVHAKVLLVDDRVCAVGSANFDVTSAYWESELMLVVEDAHAVRAYRQQVDARIAGSTRVRAEDPRWAQDARRRAWLRHWPGVLAV